MKIGIFDSGIGGLSVLREVAKLMDRCEIYYLADRLNAPYGNKTKEEVFNFCRHIVDDFISHGIDTILIACNSATAMAINELRANYPTIRFFGIEPFINVINLRPELKQQKGVVLTTKITADSMRFQNLKDRYDPQGHLVYRVSKNLAKIIEDSFDSGRLNEEEISKEIVESIFPSGEEESYDYIILGCTHYPFVKDLFKASVGAHSISPCYHVAKYVADQCVISDDGEIVEFFYYRDSRSPDLWRKVKKQNLEGFPFF
ncbi:aspartate/glutamate racemase family protein [Halobacteriovorax sp. ZH4_bin.1]|uniref:glutamate racemase n=1 Tax=unclassified Halobacteriovorax TaxID=2639665 RepID=UPI003718B436